MKNFFLCFLNISVAIAQPLIRLNQVGFLPQEAKTAIVFSNEDLSNVSFRIVDRNTKRNIISGPLWAVKQSTLDYKYVYEINFTGLKREGSYAINVGISDSAFIKIGKDLYRKYLNYPLHYLLTQHCGENPFLKEKCHYFDAIVIDGPEKGRPYDVSGGYHETSSYQRWLITTSYITGILLITYKDYPHIWGDSIDERGRYKPNNIPDVLDEARWGLEWMLKMYPHDDLLYFQIGDDRSMTQSVLPYQDSTDYGWGKGRNQPLYLATGKPQGIFEVKNSSTGISNIAGRVSAVFALASWIWKKENIDVIFAEQLLLKATKLYEIAKNNPGVSESVPCKKTTFFKEKNFYDDLEWAAVELFRATKENKYLDEAVAFSIKVADESWFGLDTLDYYEYFPLVNIAHYELYDFVKPDVKERICGYFRDGLMKAYKKSSDDKFFGYIPFVEYSNNYIVSLITQIILYKKISSDKYFDDMLIEARDYLFGKNQWGKSFVVGIPLYGNFPVNLPSSLSINIKIDLRGGLLKGPVRKDIYQVLKTNMQDNYTQTKLNTHYIYNDDCNDSITNDIVLDGSASLLYVLAYYTSLESMNTRN